ncbi:MAG TPA: SPASM domain-containing protein [Methanospirillum sp.]|uniref:SPASM domain-containing protein n=1 Tax=Methanospirillum sp. TaxID=45200 RepID=UPI002D1E2DD3|nr:SPASM domain-containing protein [Methanospirillum sp.]HWQ63661.1 SPASM domain-containing protein [Methanospirillum sp.]
MKGGMQCRVRVANVTQNGDVYPCQFVQIHECHIGSIRTRKLSELWNDQDNPVLKRFRTKKELLKGRCASCSYLDLYGGCRVRAFSQKGDFTDDDPFCFIMD